jgi:hypothetical protein
MKLRGIVTIGALCTMLLAGLPAQARDAAVAFDAGQGMTGVIRSGNWTVFLVAEKQNAVHDEDLFTADQPSRYSRDLVCAIMYQTVKYVSPYGGYFISIQLADAACGPLAITLDQTEANGRVKGKLKSLFRSRATISIDATFKEAGQFMPYLGGSRSENFSIEPDAPDTTGYVRLELGTDAFGGVRKPASVTGTVVSSYAGGITNKKGSGLFHAGAAGQLWFYQ